MLWHSGSAQLTWLTGSAQLTSLFIVQRPANNQNWTPVEGAESTVKRLPASSS